MEYQKIIFQIFFQGVQKYQSAQNYRNITVNELKRKTKTFLFFNFKMKQKLTMFSARKFHRNSPFV
jgi:hypothetical protein